MKPLQLYMDEADLRRLEAWARERRVTKSEAVRIAIRALVRPATPEDSLLSLSGVLQDDLPEDVAQNFDRHLQETFVAEAPPPYRRRPRPRR